MLLVLHNEIYFGVIEILHNIPSIGYITCELFFALHFRVLFTKIKAHHLPLVVRF